MPSLDTVLQQLVYTIALAAAYGLFAVGFLLIFGVLDVLNLAYAFVFMICAILCVWLTLHGIPFFGAILLSIAVGCALGMLTDALAYRPILRIKSLIGGVNFGPVISTLAIGQIIAAVTQNWFGTLLISFNVSEFPTKLYSIGPITITSVQIIVVVAAAVLLLGLQLVLSRTSFGRSVRAIAQNRPMAESLGINTSRVVSGVWVLSSAMAAIAGVCIVLMNRAADPTIGTNYELRGFIIVVIGGLGSVSGAILAAVIVAVLETASALYLGGQYSDMITLGAVLVLLAIRPFGLLGARRRTV
jgi:branched-chain amino acid transport system permease protein